MDPMSRIRKMNLLRRRYPLMFLKLLSKYVSSICLVLTLAIQANGQSCDLFVNPSDGADTNAGTQFSPLRSLETAYNRLPNNGILCLASGEYFKGSDADGIILSGANKTVTFRLQTFATNSEFVFSEKFFVIDVGSGSVLF